MVELFRSRRGRELLPREWSHALRFEVANLRTDRAVSNVRVRRLEAGGVVVLFTLATDLVLQPDCKEIEDDEPLAFVYGDGAVGVVAPNVFSDRIDFPKWLPHLNPVLETWPASICLAREGLQRLYEQSGVAGVVARLRRWLLDARTGSLQFDGWEPIPASQGAGVAIVDGARFQEFAKETGDERGRAWGIVHLFENGTLANIRFESLTASDGNLENTRSAFERRGFLKVHNAAFPPVPFVFLWQPASAITHEAVFREYRHGTDFQQDLARLNLGAKLDTALGEFITSRWKKNDGRPWEIVVVVGVRRPTLIIADRVGLSRDEVAGRLEIKAFLLQADRADGLLGAQARVREMSLMPDLNREVLVHVSGVTPTRSPALVGCGALGSEIAEYLIRMGVEGLTFIDGDPLLAHNLARHVGVHDRLLLNKAIVLHSRAIDILPAVTRMTHVTKRIEELTANEEDQLAASAHFIIDATAEERVRRTLPVLARRVGKRILRAEIFDGGRLGVHALEAESGNPDVVDLYYVLCGEALDDDAVSAWFRRERGDGAVGDVIAAGFSCASPSMRMPKWRVAAHATALMPTLTALVEGRERSAGVGLNFLSDEGYPVGARWIDVSAFDVRDSAGWEIRIAPAVEGQLREFSSGHAPNETGGYLYGGYDLQRKRVTVIVATPQPAGSLGTPTTLKLEKAGTTDQEARIRGRCGNRLVVVGTWHSHPGGSSKPSNKDKQTAAEFRRENEKQGLPTLLVICGKSTIGVHVFD